VKEAAEVMLTCTSAGLNETFVFKHGWSARAPASLWPGRWRPTSCRTRPRRLYMRRATPARVAVSKDLNSPAATLPRPLEAEPHGLEPGQVLVELPREHRARAETASYFQRGASKRLMTGGKGRK